MKTKPTFGSRSHVRMTALAFLTLIVPALAPMIAPRAVPLGGPLGTKLLKQIASIELPGPAGKRFDYLTIDPEDHYLFCAHLGAGNLYVIDTRTNKVVKTIPDVPGVEGVEYVPEMKRVYTSDWYEDKIGVIDLATMKVIKKIPTESKPDGSTYAAPFQKLYVSDEQAKAVAIVDVTRDIVTETLHFKGETGMPQYDPVARLVYVNLQDENILAAIDPATDQVIGRHAVGRCRGNHGMALDPDHRRAFLACGGNNLMAVIDLEKNEPIATFSVPEGADVIKFDGGLGRIYVACYSGAISIFEQKDPDHYAKLGDFRVAHAVHSLAVDPETHRVYAPEQEEDGVPVARLIVFDAQ
jgi:YVTN family beta-propeller protein